MAGSLVLVLITFSNEKELKQKCSFSSRFLTTTITDLNVLFQSSLTEARPFTTVIAMRVIKFFFVFALLLCLMEPSLVVAQRGGGGGGGRHGIRFAVI